MSKNTRGSEPASPAPAATESFTRVTEQHEGLTKRETAAIAAMQGLLAGGSDLSASHLAQEAIGHADALIAELSKDGAK